MVLAGPIYVFLMTIIYIFSIFNLRMFCKDLFERCTERIIKKEGKDVKNAVESGACREPVSCRAVVSRARTSYRLLSQLFGGRAIRLSWRGLLPLINEHRGAVSKCCVRRAYSCSISVTDPSTLHSHVYNCS